MSVRVPSSSHVTQTCTRGSNTFQTQPKFRRSSKFGCSGHKTIFFLSLNVLSPRENITNQEMDEDTKFQKSTGALISDKDRELESLRSEVGLSRHQSASLGTVETCLLFPMGFFSSAPQIAVLRGENAVAKTLQSAVQTLERDKAQLQGRVHSLEQRLMGTQASEGEHAGALPSGEQRAGGEDRWCVCDFK